MERKLEIVPNGNFKNLHLKTKYKRLPNGNFELVDGKKVVEIQGLDDGEYIIVKKVGFKEGRRIEMPTYVIYSCRVSYNDVECSFILNEKEHEIWKNVADVNENVKISAKMETSVNPKTGLEMSYMKLSFEKVD